MKIQGNTILITGGSSGIGLALAKRFIELGNRVIITGRSQEKLESIKQDLQEIDFFTGDLTNKESLLKLKRKIEEEYRDLNILINNAAIQYNYLFTESKDFSDQVDYEIAINFRAPILLTGYLLPLLGQQPSSAVVTVSSGLFLAPKMSASVYCATKAAIHSYSKTLRYQLEDSTTKVFELIPSLIDTPMTEGRGKGKISPDRLVDEFIQNFENDRYESYIGKTKMLRLLSRILPSLADKIMKHGL